LRIISIFAVLYLLGQIFAYFLANNYFPKYNPRPTGNKTANFIKLLAGQFTEEQLMKKIHYQSRGVSKDPFDFESIEVCIEENQCLPFNTYAAWRAQNLISVINVIWTLEKFLQL